MRRGFVQFSVRRAGWLAVFGTAALTTGCSTISSTTHYAGHASTATLQGTGRVSRATGNASVTAPDAPRYADARAFVASQRAQLARQAAAGGGEDIAALAFLLAKRDNRAVARWMQIHYDWLFSDRTVSATKIVNRVDAHAG